jgi:hypothetical protein
METFRQCQSDFGAFLKRANLGLTCSRCEICEDEFLANAPRLILSKHLYRRHRKNDLRYRLMAHKCVVQKQDDV